MIRVLAAVIRRDTAILLAKRPAEKRHGSLWEFPGGKMAPGEDYLSAAKREVREELGVEVTAVGPILFEAQDPGSEFLIQFLQVWIDGDPRALEHETLNWVQPSELLSYNLAPTDRAFACSWRPLHA